MSSVNNIKCSHPLQLEKIRHEVYDEYENKLTILQELEQMDPVQKLEYYFYPKQRFQGIQSFFEESNLWFGKSSPVPINRPSYFPMYSTVDFFQIL